MLSTESSGDNGGNMSEETTETTEAPKEEPKGLRATIDKQAGRIKESIHTGNGVGNVLWLSPDHVQRRPVS